MKSCHVNGRINQLNLEGETIVRKTIAKWSVCGLLIVSLTIAVFVRAIQHRSKPTEPSNQMIGGAFTTEFEGRQVTLQIPKMELKTKEDKDKLQAILVEQMKTNPQVITANDVRFEEWKEKNRQSLIADLDDAEKRDLARIAQMSIAPEQKVILEKQLRESVGIAKRQIEEKIATTKMTHVQ